MKDLTRLPFALALMLVATASIALAQSSSESGRSESVVRTIAGDGTPGISDGPANGPAFLMPVAVAVDKDGSLLVVDQAAQRIRRVSNGRVVTIAGSGTMSDHFAQVDGGYRDGEALDARFDEPSGIAVGADGAIYVADQMNHCIRRLAGSFVSMHAGSCTHAGTNDGSLALARFQRPIAIASAPSGELFVADFGVGLREIYRGSVRTIELPLGAAHHLVGVAVSGTGKSITVVAVEDNGFYYMIRPSGKEPARVFNGSEGGHFARMYALAGVNEFEYIATDLKQNLVSQLRMPDPPFVSQPAITTIAGSIAGESQNSGGFADGALSAARFYSPLGLAVSGQTIFVCDTGNRRVRSLPLPDVRRPVGSSLDDFQPDASHYRIFLFGSSDIFWNTNWQESVPGLFERGLADDRASIGLSMAPRVSAARLDETNFVNQADYAGTYAANGSMQLAVMLLEADALDTVGAKPGDARDAIAIRVLKDLKAKFDAVGTAFFVSVRGDPFVASQVDDIYDRNFSARAPYSAAKYVALRDEFDSVLRASGVAYGLDLDSYVAYNALPIRTPLWSFEDTHENENGRRFAANRLVAEIEAMHPWQRAASPPTSSTAR